MVSKRFLVLASVTTLAGVYALAAVSLVGYWTSRRRSAKYLAELRHKFPYSFANIAHRGGSLIGPENTMYTFKRAIVECNADMIELDVHESKDGYIVVCHDDKLFRICGDKFLNVGIADIAVAGDLDITLPQCLRRIPLHFQTDMLQCFEAAEDVPVDSTTRICLLSEVFETFPGVPIHLDIKSAGFEGTKRILDMIEKHGREIITFVGSSNPRVRPFIMKCLYDKGTLYRNKFRVFAGEKEFAMTYLYFYLGLLPFVNLDYDVFSIPVFTAAMRRDAERNFGKLVARIGSFFLTSPTLWTYLQSRGIAVVGWVLNDEECFLEAANWYLNGIITDDPRLLHNFFKNRIPPSMMTHA